MEIRESSYSERTRKVGVYILYNLACASVQPDTDEVRSGLHSPYLRHENNKKKQAERNTLLVFVVEIRGVEPLTS